MELIVFDLDGTLLNDASQISCFTRDTLSLLAENNIAYTLATGRTLHSAQGIIEGHGFTLPHIYSNGVLIWDPSTDKLSLENLLTVAESEYILQIAEREQITPFVATIDNRHQHFIYHPPVKHAVEKRLRGEFLARGDVRIESLSTLPTHAQVTNISMLAEGVIIDRVQSSINQQEHLIAYSGPAIEGEGLKWIDIHHSKASKGGALELLRRQLGVNKIICFGDSDNDLSMFAMADESYAPANARAEIKAAATAVIGHHDADGIAHFLRERFVL